MAELLAMITGLRIVTSSGCLCIYSDSQSVIQYWTKGFMNRHRIHPMKVEWIEQSIVLRKQFEEMGVKLTVNTTLPTWDFTNKQ